jgi:ATP-dependent DNA helicase RecG
MFPTASVMIIESAGFWTSQLHQLRGRGSWAEQSYCIFGWRRTNYRKTVKSEWKTTRTNDGFEIAEVDLKLRGPGDMGKQQSGI